MMGGCGSTPDRHILYVLWFFWLLTKFLSYCCSLLSDSSGLVSLTCLRFSLFSATNLTLFLHVFFLLLLLGCDGSRFAVCFPSPGGPFPLQRFLMTFNGIRYVGTIFCLPPSSLSFFFGDIGGPAGVGSLFFSL